MTGRGPGSLAWRGGVAADGGRVLCCPGRPIDPLGREASGGGSARRRTIVTRRYCHGLLGWVGAATAPRPPPPARGPALT